MSRKGKMQKLIIGMSLMLVMVVQGCSNPGTAALVAGAGAGASHTLLGLNKDLEEALLAKNAELQAALESIDSATSQAEKLAAEAKAKALEKQIENLGDVQTGAVLVEEGLSTDWTNPQAVGGYSATVIAAVMAYLLRKKSNKYSAIKAGVNKYMANGDSSKAGLYKAIGEERARKRV